jgi:flagellar biosynthesis protein FliR
MTAPLALIPGLGWRFRLVFAFMLAVLIAPSVGPCISFLPTLSRTAWVAAIEVIVGALLGWSAALIVAGARQAGELVGAQAGLSAAAFFDPVSGEEITPLGQLYGLIALAVFLALDGPLVLVGALLESYRTLPPGDIVLNQDLVTRAFSQLVGALALALRAAAPPVISLAFAGAAMGWLGRIAPAVPVLALSLPVRSILGIILVFLSLVTLVATLSRAWMSWPGLL